MYSLHLTAVCRTVVDAKTAVNIKIWWSKLLAKFNKIWNFSKLFNTAQRLSLSEPETEDESNIR